MESNHRIEDGWGGGLDEEIGGKKKEDGYRREALLKEKGEELVGETSGEIEQERRWLGEEGLGGREAWHDPSRREDTQIAARIL